MNNINNALNRIAGEKVVKQVKLHMMEKSKQLDCCVWVEYFDDGEDEPDLEPGLIVNFRKFRSTETIYQISVRLGHRLVKEQHDYNLKWRCWLRRPTDDERQAAKWGGNHAD